MISKTLSWEKEDSISIVFHSLSRGGLVVGSSDTVFGLLANVTKEGFQSLNRAKGRYEKPYLILIGNKQVAHSLIENISLQAEKLMDFWPAPLTLIFKAKKELPDYMKTEQGTIALRMPDHVGLLSLLKKIPMLFSTSANKTGEAVPCSIQGIDQTILNAIDYIIIDGQQKEKETQPSTILDCSGDGIKLVREGAFSIEEIEKAFNLVIQKK